MVGQNLLFSGEFLYRRVGLGIFRRSIGVAPGPWLQSDDISIPDTVKKFFGIA